MITIVISTCMVCIVYLLYYVNKHKKKIKNYLLDLSSDSR